MPAPEEAIVNSTIKQYSHMGSLSAGPIVITPEPGKRIIVQSWSAQHDYSSAVLTFSSPGKPTVNYRSPSGQESKQAFPFFVCADSEALTIALTGGTGTDFGLSVFWMEV